jgi:Leucine-rich repeat (LRR) protein
LDLGIAPIATRELTKLAGGALIKALAASAAMPGAEIVESPVRLGGGILRSPSKVVGETKVRSLVRTLLLRVTDFEPKMRGLADGQEVEDALVRTLLSMGELTADSVQHASLDVVRFTDELRRGEPLYNNLSPDGRTLYDGVLHACAANVIEHFTRSPSFTARSLLEQSVGLGKLLGDADAFRERYFSYIEQVLDEQQLFGLRLRADAQTYKLSTAYVSLSMERVGEYSVRRRPYHDADRAANAVDRLDPERVIAEHRLLIVDGPAGSGKTTLLKRIALHAIRHEFTGRLAEWNGIVPFFLQVRQFSDAALPQPDKFLATVARPLHGEEPHQWISVLLRSGKAVLLVDGVDEVPISRRPALIEWIIELTRAFPAAPVVVTSRPGAIEDQRDRMQSVGFSGARIEPMNQAQVAEFVRLWHKAYADNTEHQGIAEERAVALISAIESRRDLARLATSPLLCAMLCALNVNSNSWLPRERARLYRDALEMLLERRDREQHIETSVIRLGSQHLEPILARLAFWMLLNGRRTITDEQATQQIVQMLPRIRGSRAPSEVLSAEEVLEHVVARSGLLQRSSDLNLEFRHPSFQDYLSAAEVFRQDQVEHLVRQAHDPLYHDVVIMAIAQTQSDPKRQSDFLRALIDRAASDLPHSRVLWLLAAAAITDAGMVDPAIEGTIAEATKNLLPPQNFDQAYEIADVGEFALDLLNEVVDQRAVEKKNLEPNEAAATIRAACLVDARDSTRLLKKLVSYAPGNPLVQSDLLLGWRNAIDQALFEREVLRTVDFISASFHAGQRSDLNLFRAVRAIRMLSIGEWCTNDDIRAIQNLEQLEELKISNSAVGDLSFLEKWPRLRLLDASQTPVRETSSLSLVPSLVSLSLAGCAIEDITTLAALKKLQSCVLSLTGITNIDALDNLPNLTELDISKTMVGSLRPLATATALVQLSVTASEIMDLDPIGTASRLETLDIARTSIRSFEPLDGLVRLRKIDAHMTEVADLSPLAGCGALQELDIGNTVCTSLEPLGALHNLRRLDASWTRVTTVEPLSELPSLKEINLCGTRVDDLRHLANLPALKTICLEHRQQELPGVASLRSRSDVTVVGPSQW